MNKDWRASRMQLTVVLGVLVFCFFVMLLIAASWLLPQKSFKDGLLSHFVLCSLSFTSSYQIPGAFFTLLGHTTRLAMRSRGTEILLPEFPSGMMQHPLRLTLLVCTATLTDFYSQTIDTPNSSQVLGVHAHDDQCPGLGRRVWYHIWTYVAHGSIDIAIQGS